MLACGQELSGKSWESVGIYILYLAYFDFVLEGQDWEFLGI